MVVRVDESQVRPLAALIADWLGHANLTMTDRYSHVSSDMLRAAAATLEAWLAGDADDAHPAAG